MEGSIKMIAFYNMAEEDAADEEEELQLEVRMVREGGDEWFEASEDSCDIVIDSGADATSMLARTLVEKRQSCRMHRAKPSRSRATRVRTSTLRQKMVARWRSRRRPTLQRG